MPFSSRTCALFLSFYVVIAKSFVPFFFPFSYQPLLHCDECECNIRYCIFLLSCNVHFLFCFFFTTFLVKQNFVLGVHPLPRRRRERFLHNHDNFFSLPSFMELRAGVGKRGHSTILHQFLIAPPALPLAPTPISSKNSIDNAQIPSPKFHIPLSKLPSCKTLQVLRIDNLPNMLCVVTLTLGSRLKQGFARLRTKKEARSHTTYSRECEKA